MKSRHLSQKDIILDIAMNLCRIGNWAADDYWVKKKRLDFFLKQTSSYLKSIDQNWINPKFGKTFNKFKSHYYQLLKERQTLKHPLVWAEKMLTWGNILTHRARLLG